MVCPNFLKSRSWIFLKQLCDDILCVKKSQTKRDGIELKLCDFKSIKLLCDIIDISKSYKYSIVHLGDTERTFPVFRYKE